MLGLVVAAGNAAAGASSSEAKIGTEYFMNEFTQLHPTLGY
jgi:hypothetical protein